MTDDAADRLAEWGAVVGGGAVLGATTGFVAGRLGRDLGWAEADPIEWAEAGAAYGGLFGIVLLMLRGAGVN